jgi:tRNA G18 (ribose-2'-O)-methylase SpoU
MTFVLCNIRSSWNVGSAFRTADCLGAKIIVVGYTPRPVGSNLKLINKTAIGAENTVAWEEFEQSSEVFEKYSEKIHLAAEISDQSLNIFDFLNNCSSDENSPIWDQIKKQNDVLIWFGNEIHGVEPEVLKNCNKTIHLPMWGQKESLNVASSLSAFGYLIKYGMSK